MCRKALRAYEIDKSPENLEALTASNKAADDMYLLLGPLDAQMYIWWAKSSLSE